MEALTINQAHEAFHFRTFSARDLVSHYLARIQSIDKSGPTLNGILAISSTAVAEAGGLDKHLSETGKFKGPLHGIPVIVKDQAATKGLTSTYGSVKAKDNVPTEDATLVTKLKDAGAIVIAKSSMPDWATSWFSTSSLTGTTKNPYDLSRDVGGSSSGTGSSIAADLAILGVGEDTGGSIRLPASFCGLVGLRPTPGMISRYGMNPLVVPQDTPGPMCRTVRDAALMFDAMVGFDPKDSFTTANLIAQQPRGGSYAASLEEAKVSDLRIGVVDELFGTAEDHGMALVSTCVRSALTKLKQSGAEVKGITLPRLQEYAVETSLYQTRSQNDLDKFFSTNTHSSLSQLSVRSIHEENAFHPSLDLFNLIASGPKSPHDDPDYAKKLLAQDDFRRFVLSTMAEHDVDLLAFPDCKIAAPRTQDVLGGKWGIYDFPTNTLLASQAILPAISVPVGLTDGDGEGGGLPVGLELVGFPYGEQRLFEAASVVERLVDGRRPPEI